jgi:hypothetical protein
MLIALHNRTLRFAAVAVIVLLCAGVTSYFLMNGPRHAGDTGRYLNGADQLLAGDVVGGKARSYFGYVLVVAAAKSLPLEPQDAQWALVIFQALVLVAATICVYHLGALLFPPAAGLIAAALYSVNVYALRWTPFVLTEALFIALVIITTWLCVLAARRPWLAIAAVPAVLFTALIRPNGLAMLPVFGIYLLAQLRGKVRIGAFALAALAVIAVLPTIHDKLNAVAGREDLVANLEHGTVIWGVNRIAMPHLEDRSGDQVVDVARYVARYPLATLRLAARRLLAAYWFPRDDYSKKHRLALMIALPLLYILALGGVAVAWRTNERRDFLLPLGLIAAQSAVIAVSFANHDHRFVIYIMAFLFLFAAMAASRLAGDIPNRGRFEIRE